MADQNRPIVVKRVKKGAHGAHGGSWKVAYADFMTAMMAFFLLMWILQTATKEQKAGIAQYFTTGTIMDSSTVGGETILTGGMETLETTEAAQAMPFAGFDGSNEFPELSPQRERLLQQEKDMFDRARIALEEAMQSDPALMELNDSLVISQTKEGMQIQLIDLLNHSIFRSGSDELTPNGFRLTGMLARVLQKMPHSMVIEGHTDAVPYTGKKDYSNWELSSDRALAFRRTLIKLGIKENKITRVIGKSSTEPYVKSDPKAPQNRRISVTLVSFALQEEEKKEEKAKNK
ncbi:MAG: OmpA family protein [Alphaproteobacteria bacterium]|nr:OmpA family protein [Alphaproteobacteria bacterium]MBO4643277.1 OmpA family protein [Alphaproteobacteria bacterium]